jgi:hypothetical protein
MRRQRLLFALGAGFLLFLVVASVLWYEANHVRIDFSNEQVSDAQIALKGSIGQAIFSAKQDESLPRNTAISSTDLDSVLAPGPSVSEGLIDAYRKTPHEYERYARMLDTAINAKQVGEAVLKLASSQIPHSSVQLAIDSRTKVDSWGNPFCIIPLVGRIAVVSGGPSKAPCNALQLSIEQLSRSERTVFTGPSESVIVILSNK